MYLTIENYLLPADVLAKIIEVAVSADALFIGEIHGNQETPRIMAGLLPTLHQHGYRGFGVEVPLFEQDHLRRWLSDSTSPIPDFYSKPWPDGRGSREMLALIQRAHQTGFQVFCFDPGLVSKNAAWAERDAGMAQNTQETWQQEFPNDKIILMCGNNHAFLKPHPQAGSDFWPSFAECLRRLISEKQYATLELTPTRGEFFNFGIRRLGDYYFTEGVDQPLEQPQIGSSASVTLQVQFPTSSAATYLDAPKLPGQFSMLFLLASHMLQRVKAWLSRLIGG